MLVWNLVIALLLFAFHTEWQITCAQPLQGLHSALFIFAHGSVTVTAIHTLAFSLSFTLTSQSVSPPPPHNDPSSVVASFSRYSLPITSSPIRPSFTVRLSGLAKHETRGRFLSAETLVAEVATCSSQLVQQPEGTVCSAAWGGKGWVYLITTYLLRHANVTSVLLVARVQCEDKSDMKEDTANKKQDVPEECVPF